MWPEISPYVIKKLPEFKFICDAQGTISIPCVNSQSNPMEQFFFQAQLNSEKILLFLSG